MFLAVLTLLALVALGELCGRVIVTRLALPIFESSPPFQVQPHRPNAAAESFRIPIPSVRGSDTAANESLAAALFLPPQERPRALIVFCPEYGADRWSCQTYCAGLQSRGYAILAFDFRNQGESSPVATGYEPTHWVTCYERDDVLTVIDWAHAESRFAGVPLVLMGVSRGAGAAVAAAAVSPVVAAVIADSAFSPRTMMLHFFYRWARLYVPDWLPAILPRWYVATLLRPVEWIVSWRRRVRFVHLESALRRLRSRPVLMISGERDSYCLPRFTTRLQRLTQQDRRRAWIVPEARHNGARKVNPAAYDDRIDELLEQALGVTRGGVQIPAPHLTFSRAQTGTTRSS